MAKVPVQTQLYLEARLLVSFGSAQRRNTTTTTELGIVPKGNDVTLWDKHANMRGEYLNSQAGTNSLFRRQTKSTTFTYFCPEQVGMTEKT